MLMIKYRLKKLTIEKAQLTMAYCQLSFLSTVNYFIITS